MPRNPCESYQKNVELLQSKLDSLNKELLHNTKDPHTANLIKQNIEDTTRALAKAKADLAGCVSEQENSSGNNNKTESKKCKELQKQFNKLSKQVLNDPNSSKGGPLYQEYVKVSNALQECLEQEAKENSESTEDSEPELAGYQEGPTSLFDKWLFTKCPAAYKPKNMMIGPMWLPTPPTKIESAEIASVYTLPLLRSHGDPHFKNPQSNLEIKFSAIFNGVAEINGFVYNDKFPSSGAKFGSLKTPFWSQKRQGGLRDIVAMFYRTPFTTLINDFVSNIMNPGPNRKSYKLNMMEETDENGNRPKNYFADVIENSDLPQDFLSRRVPVALQGITISTIPGAIDALEVNISVLPMDCTPLTPDFSFIYSCMGAYIQNSAFHYHSEAHSDDYYDYLRIARTANPSNSEPYLRWYRGMLDEYYSETGKEDMIPPLEIGWHMFSSGEKDFDTHTNSIFYRGLEDNDKVPKVYYSKNRLSQVSDLGNPLIIRLPIAAVTEDMIYGSQEGIMQNFATALELSIQAANDLRNDAKMTSTGLQERSGMWDKIKSFWFNLIPDFVKSTVEFGSEQAAKQYEQYKASLQRYVRMDGGQQTLNVAPLLRKQNPIFMTSQQFEKFNSNSFMASSGKANYQDEYKNWNKQIGIEFTADDYLILFSKPINAALNNTLMNMQKLMTQLTNAVVGETQKGRPNRVKSEEYTIVFSRTPLNAKSYDNTFGYTITENRGKKVMKVLGQSAITSISATMQNKLVPTKLESQMYPFYQYLGRSDWTVTMSIQTTSMGLIRCLRQMSLHASRTERLRLGAKPLATAQALGSQKVTILPFHVELDNDFFNGVLGVREFIIEGVTYTTVPNSPGLYEVNINFISDDIRIQDYESLVPSSVYDPEFYAKVLQGLKKYTDRPAPLSPEDNYKYGKDPGRYAPGKKEITEWRLSHHGTPDECVKREQANNFVVAYTELVNMDPNDTDKFKSMWASFFNERIYKSIENQYFSATDSLKKVLSTAKKRLIHWNDEYKKYDQLCPHAQEMDLENVESIDINLGDNPGAGAGWIWLAHLAQFFNSDPQGNIYFEGKNVKTSDGKSSGNEYAYMLGLMGYDSICVPSFNPFYKEFEEGTAGKLVMDAADNIAKKLYGESANAFQESREGCNQANVVNVRSNEPAVLKLINGVFAGLAGAHFRANLDMLLSYGGYQPPAVKKLMYAYNKTYSNAIMKYRGYTPNIGAYPDMELPEYSIETAVGPAFYFYRYPESKDLDKMKRALERAQNLTKNSYLPAISANSVLGTNIELSNKGVDDYVEAAKKIYLAGVIYTNARLQSAFTASYQFYAGTYGNKDLVKTLNNSKAMAPEAIAMIQSNLKSLNNLCAKPLEPKELVDLTKDIYAYMGAEQKKEASEEEKKEEKDNKSDKNPQSSKEFAPINPFKEHPPTEAEAKILKAMGLIGLCNRVSESGAIVGDPDFIIKYARSFGTLTSYGLNQDQSIYNRVLQTMKESLKRNSSGSMEMCFPTYNISFAEEDSPGMNFDLHDWYSYSAVMSIHIAKAVEDAGATGEIIFENLLGVITDPTWTLVHKEFHSLRVVNTIEGGLLTVLNVQPGMGIQIRLGYGPDVRQLPLVLVGRVTDVQDTDGVVTVQCHSYGAMLHQKIGMGSPISYGGKLGTGMTINSFGAICSASLNELSGLEDLGQTPKIISTLSWAMLAINHPNSPLTWKADLGYLGHLSKAISGIPLIQLINKSWDWGKFGHFLLASNIVVELGTATYYLTRYAMNKRDERNKDREQRRQKGQTDKEELSNYQGMTETNGPFIRASMLQRFLFAQYPNMLFNPRDDNIMLAYDNSMVFGDGLGLQFDYKIYDQSVWEVLQNIAHHHDDHVAAVLPFDEDSFRHSRETIYVGKRDGWYKFTNDLGRYAVLQSQDQFGNMYIQSGIGNLKVGNPSMKGGSNQAPQIIIGAPRDLITGGVINPALWSIKKSNGKSAFTDLLKKFNMITWEEKYNNSQYVGPPSDRSQLVDPSGKIRPLFDWPELQRGWSVAKDITTMKSDASIMAKWSLSQTRENLAKLYVSNGVCKSEDDAYNKIAQVEYSQGEGNTIRLKILQNEVLKEQRKISKKDLDREDNIIPHPQYRPIRTYNFINSYQHILSNRMSASTQEMYNRVHFIYPQKGGKCYKLEPEKFDREYICIADDSIKPRNWIEKGIYDGNISPGWLDSYLAMGDIMEIAKKNKAKSDAAKSPEMAVEPLKPEAPDEGPAKMINDIKTTVQEGMGNVFKLGETTYAQTAYGKYKTARKEYDKWVNLWANTSPMAPVVLKEKYKKELDKAAIALQDAYAAYLKSPQGKTDQQAKDLMNKIIPQGNQITTDYYKAKDTVSDLIDLRNAIIKRMEEPDSNQVSLKEQLSKVNEQINNANKKLSETSKKDAQQDRKRQGEDTKQDRERQGEDTGASTEVEDDSLDIANGVPHYMKVAHEYLADGVRKMYNGQIALLGMTALKPLDIVYIADFTNGIFGPIEVGAISHQFDAETGLKTFIRPHAIVATNNRGNIDDIKLFSQYYSTLSKYSMAAIWGGSIGVGVTAGLLVGRINPILGALGGVAAFGATLAKGYDALDGVCRTGLGFLFGRECIDLVPLLKWGMPFTAGLDGYRKSAWIFEFAGNVKDFITNVADMALPRPQ